LQETGPRRPTARPLGLRGGGQPPGVGPPLQGAPWAQQADDRRVPGHPEVRVPRRRFRVGQIKLIKFYKN
jgi:hypothetical protein